MTFIEKNKYFIQQALFAGMKNLSLKEKIIKYETFRYGKLTIKEEIKSRIKDYYIECKSNEIDIFYAELFELLSDYESNYLTSNLVYEKNFVSIVNYLLKENLLKNLSFNSGYNVETFYKYIISKYATHKSFKISDYKYFIVSEFCKLFKNDDLLNEEEIDEFPFLKKYSSWLIKNILTNVVESRQSFFYFVALWTSFLRSKSINEKGIFFYHYLIEELNKTSKDGLYNFITFNEIYYKDLFVSIVHVPLINKESLVVYTEGYKSKRDAFNKIVEISKKTNEINQVESLIDLLIIMNNNSDLDIFLKTKKIFESKIINKSINCEIIKKIVSLELNEEINKIRLGLLKKQYRYEYYYLFNNINNVEENFSNNKIKTKYSDLELSNFKIIINEKIEKLISELNYYNNTTITHIGYTENQLKKIRIPELKLRLAKYQAALIKIDDKTFGICENSGEIINEYRLLSFD